MNNEYITNLFLSDSYNEQLEDYNKILKKEKDCLWDIVVITASNKKQARTYEKQISKRKKFGLLPFSCDFLVIPDKYDKRIGSGGATLNVIKILNEKYDDFSKLKILLIHSGGDSKRIPQYSIGGKLFSPVPRELSPFFSSTLFDELMIMFCNVPLRMDAGILTICGDALLLFNSLQLDMQYKDLASITMKAPIEQGENHGVVVEKNGIVDKFLHKCSKEILINEKAAFNNQVNIDTGIIYFSYKVIKKFINIIEENYDLLISDNTRLNLYGDMLYPFAFSSSLENYLQEPAEFEINDDLIKARKLIWSLRDNIEYSIIKLSPSKFIHFGTSKELYDLMVNNNSNYESIGWKRIVNSTKIENKVCLINSIIINSEINNSFVENSIVANSKIGSNTIISNTDLKNKIVPDNICLSTTKVKNGYVTRIYGIEDDPKKLLSNGLMNFDVSKANKKYDLRLDLNKTLWESEIYVVGSSISQSVNYALSLYNILNLTASNKEVNKWLSGQKMSLSSSFNEANVIDNDKLILSIMEDRIINNILKRDNLNELANLINKSIYKNRIIRDLKKNINKYSIYKKTRINYILSLIDKNENNYKNIFNSIKENILIKDIKPLGFNFVKEEVDIYLPVRLNFGGGWSDTPPYCIDNGGIVLNAAVKLNGKLPIHARIEKLKEKKLIIESYDLGKNKEFTTSKEIYNCSDPNDSFALVKAAIVVTGLVDKFDEDLNNLFTKVNGGIKIITDVKNIPRGSGLGTSSILSGALIKAIYEFTNIKRTLYEISNDVLSLEQLMSTGGGWQDQVGGIFPGIKLISTKSGNNQILEIKNIKLTDDFIKNFNNRFILINTGQRRLARNLLRDIVIKYISNDNVTLDVLKSIQILAKKQAKAIDNNNIKEFGLLLNRHWDIIKKMDPGCTNLCIDTIVRAIDDCIYGKAICGAGGGGFILAVLKEEVSKKQIQDKLAEVFADTDVQLYDIELYLDKM